MGLLGIIGTVVTSVVTSNNTRRATERTVQAGAEANRATLTAAREDRLWERQADSYHEVVRGLLYRQRQRNAMSDQVPFIDAQELRESFASYEPPDWNESLARLVSYAPDDVLGVSNFSEEVDERVRYTCEYMLGLFDDRERALAAGEVPSSDDVDELQDVRGDLSSVIKEAEEADQALMRIIREKLRQAPEAISQPPAHPLRRSDRSGELS